MLSAQKGEQRVVAVTSKPSVGSFSRVANSIEVLQERLGGLDLDEIIEAETKTKTLQVHLLQLQNTLDVLSNLKRIVAAAAHAIEQMPVPSLPSIEFELSSRPLHVQHLLPPPSKLIPFPRPVKAPKDKPKKIPVDARKESSPPSNRILPEKPSVRPSTTEHTRAEKQLLSSAPVEQNSAKPTAPVSETAGNELNELPSKRHDSEQPGYDSAERIFPSPEIRDADSRSSAAIPSQEDPLHTSSPPQEDPQASGMPEFPRQDELPSEQFDFTAERTTKPNLPHHDGVLDTAPPEPAPVTGQTQGEFDQRLLDDLIRNYGEFTVSPNLPAVVEPEIVDNEPKRQTAATGARIGAHDIRKSNSPLHKKEAELDRQLKQIIKDYGEFDLYSQQSPVNFKKRVIAAFALLGMLLCGFYFFSAPKAARHEPTVVTQEEKPLTAKVKGESSSAGASDSDPQIKNRSTQQKN